MTAELFSAMNCTRCFLKKLEVQMVYMVRPIFGSFNPKSLMLFCTWSYKRLSHISLAASRNLRVAEERWRRIDVDVVPPLEADVSEAGAEIYWILQDFQVDQGGIIEDHCRYWCRDVLHFSLSFFYLFFLVFFFPISLSVLKHLLFVPCLCLFLHFFSGFLPFF